MLRTITKIGNSQGLIFDSALRDLTGLRAGDQVNVTVHDGGTIAITLMRATIAAADATKSARALIKANAEIFKRLSE